MNSGRLPKPALRLDGHFQELDGLRGIAILLVVLHHFWPSEGPLAALERVAHLGWIGVDLFFVISGFLITGILLDTIGTEGYYLNFFARRVLRIFPLYYAFLIAAFTLIPLAQHGTANAGEFLRQSGSPAWYVLYLGNVREAIVGVEPGYVLGPVWSLSIEEQFYCTFPLVVASLSRARLRTLLLTLLVFAPMFRLVTSILVPANERIQYLATPSRVDVLALGCLIALEARRAPERLRAFRADRWLMGLSAAMVVAFVLGGLDRTRLFCRVAGYSLVSLTFAALVTWTIQRRGSSSVRWLRASPLCYLGKLCYGIYLLQRPAEVILLKVSTRLHYTWNLGSPQLLLAKCLATLGLAMVSYYAFERKVLALKRLFVSSAHPSAVAIPSEPLTAEETA